MNLLYIPYNIQYTKYISCLSKSPNIYICIISLNDMYSCFCVFCYSSDQYFYITRLLIIII